MSVSALPPPSPCPRAVPTTVRVRHLIYLVDTGTRVRADASVLQWKMKMIDVYSITKLALHATLSYMMTHAG